MRSCFLAAMRGDAGEWAVIAALLAVSAVCGWIARAGPGEGDDRELGPW